MFVLAVLWTAFVVVSANVAMMIPLLPFNDTQIAVLLT